MWISVVIGCFVNNFLIKYIVFLVIIIPQLLVEVKAIFAN